MATRDRNVGGDPSALAADRLLGDLDDDLLAFAEQGVDIRRRLSAAVARAASAALRGAVVAIRFDRVVVVIARVEERRFFETDVHKRGLHSGQYSSYAPLDDGAGDVALVVSLDVKFCE